MRGTRSAPRHSASPRSGSTATTHRWTGTGRSPTPCSTRCQSCRRWSAAPDRPQLALRHVLAAVDLDDLAGDIPAHFVRSEVDERARAFVGAAEPVHRNGGLHRLELLRI